MEAVGAGSNPADCNEVMKVNKIANMERRTCEEQGVPAKHIVRGDPDRGRNPLFPPIHKL